MTAKQLRKKYPELWVEIEEIAWNEIKEIPNYTRGARTAVNSIAFQVVYKWHKRR